MISWHRHVGPKKNQQKTVIISLCFRWVYITQEVVVTSRWSEPPNW